jgi:hypothetical protein
MCVCDDGVSEIGKSRETLHVCPALLICSQVMFVVVDPWQTTAVTPRERVDVNVDANVKNIQGSRRTLCRFHGRS